VHRHGLELQRSLHMVVQVCSTYMYVYMHMIGDHTP
jgi:hypothetical protein